MAKTLKYPFFDVVLSVGFPWLIPISLLYESEIPSFNIHPSNLPSYWGPDPIRNQIIKGESHFGVSLHYHAKDFDTGEVIFQKSIKNDNSMCINEILYRLGVLIIPFFSNLLQKDLKILSQKQRLQTTNRLDIKDYAPPIKLDLDKANIQPYDFNQIQSRLVGLDEWKDRLLCTKF